MLLQLVDRRSVSQIRYESPSVEAIHEVRTGRHEEMPQQKLDVTLGAKMCRPEPLVPVSLRGEHIPHKNLPGGRLADKFKPLIQRGLLYLEDFIVIHNELHVPSLILRTV
jgi:hypothetical protein